MLSWFRESFPPNEIAKYVLWNNKNIVINGKSLFWKNFFENNITMISQMLKQNNQLMNLNDLRDIYDIQINFLKYHGLFSIIIKHFKEHVKHTFIHTDLHVSKHLSIIDTKNAKSKIFYTEIIKDKVQSPTCIQFWKSFSVSEKTLYSSMRFIRNATKESKLIAFQHKVIHNYVAHNVNMKKWSMKDSENCRYCNEKETLLHMLANCPETVKIQKRILRVLRTNCITVNEFTFGSNDKAETLIFLVAKLLLWSTRFHGSDLNIYKIIS